MRTALSVLLLALVAMAVLHYGSLGERMLPRVDLPENSDYYLRRATVRQMNPQGLLAYRMDVTESLHFPDDTSELTDIDVHYMGGSDADDAAASGEWILHADHGHVPPGQEEILLRDNVSATMRRDDGDNVKIETDEAWIRPNRNRIETESRVTARSGARTAQGTGMTVFLEDDRLKLHNDVSVRYEP
ncbi:MAG: LPS export ABC transporter periplasmic protein LptC [Salinisphaeraceae bacterium]|jgi:LPS export ABC transporter protein LptC|nr:LPS export ABC transporter periplasmic protein LptC [Salinisphaeraceae bacterium]